MKRLAVLVVSVLAIVIPSPVRAAVTSDVTVFAVRQSVAYGPSGTKVVFRAYGQNLGPGSSDLFVGYDNDQTALRHLADEAHGLRERCVQPSFEAGDFDNVSPDTPTCEWTDVPEGDFAFVKIVTWLEGTPGQYGRIAFCAGNGFDPTEDPNLDNNCRGARVLITSEETSSTALS